MPELDTYRAKRDFSRTAEPSGGDGPSADAGNRFVVQRHRATRLHYDFRLEMGGVLASWAVPKGPTLDPKARRMAVHVEDHPVEYFDFEGTIPRGEYGGGDVIVWDWGTWELAKEDDPVAAVQKGELHFDLFGERLRGRFVLTRTKRDNDKDWLLLHKNDEFAVPGWNAEDIPTSVKSGRTNDEVLAAPEDEWTHDRPTVAKWAATMPSFAVPAIEGPEKDGLWEFAGQEMKVTNLDKVLFPGPVTKRDLIRYNARVAPYMLRYLVGRPVNPLRFPDGVEKQGFWHKARPDWAPAFVGAWQYPGADPGETEVYCVVDNPAALAWMGQYGAIELNPWTSRCEAPETPSWALIDIDPGPDTTWDEVLILARLCRTALDHLGVVGGPKVTGKRGIQIWVPVAERYSFDETREWVETLMRAVGATVPEVVSWAWEKRSRGGKARLDFTQNAINKTLVAPFSARPAAGAPVSMTIEWDELDDPDLRPDRWTIADAVERLEQVGDPLARLVGLQQPLPDFG